MSSAWPTHFELTNYLRASGLIAIDSPTDADSLLDLEGAVAAAIEDYQDAVGYIPFLGETAEVDLLYTPSGSRILDLENGFYSISAITLGVTTTLTGTAQTINEDVWLRPINAAANGIPYTWLEFQFVLQGLPDSIKVTGKRGYGATIPQNAYNAVQARAAWYLYPQIVAQKTGGLKARQAGDEREEYGDKPLATTRDSLEAIFLQSVKGLPPRMRIG